MKETKFYPSIYQPYPVSFELIDQFKKEAKNIDSEFWLQKVTKGLRSLFSSRQLLKTP